MKHKISTYIFILIGLSGCVYFIYKGEDAWVFATAMATVLLWIVASAELGGMNKVTKADFIKKFSDGFFKDETRDILMLLDYDALSFKIEKVNYTDKESRSLPYFSANEEIVKQLKLDSGKQKNILEKKLYSSYEIDDYLLGPIESIAYFEKRGLLNIEQVYDDFDHYINLIYDSCVIQEYIQQQRNEEKDGENIYDGLEYIYEKCDSYETHVIQNKRPLLIWKMQWWISKIFFKI